MNANVQEVIEKHVALDPESLIIISLKDEKVTYGITNNIPIPTLLFMQKVLAVHVEKLFDNLRKSYEKP